MLSLIRALFFLHFLFAVCCFISEVAAQSFVFAIKASEEETVLEGLNSFVQILEDSTDALTFEEVSSEAFQTRYEFYASQTPQNAHRTYWGRISIQNQKDSEEDWVLQFGERHQVEFLEAFISATHSNWRQTKTGYFCPVSKKDIAYDGIGASIRLNFKIGETKTIFFKFYNVSGFVPQLNVKLLERDAFSEKTKLRAILQGLLQGILLIMIGYNLLIFFINRDKAYLYYTLYMTCLSLYFQYFYGHLQVYFLGEYLRLAPVAWIVAVGFFSVSYFSFLLSALGNNVHILAPIRFFQLFKIVFTSVLLLMYSIKVSFFYWVVHLLVAIIPLECLFTFFISYRLYCQKDATARYFIFGSTILYIGILTNLTYYLLTGKHLPPPDGLHVGLFLEILLFSLGLGHRMNLNEREKQKAQQELIRQLQENERLQASIQEELEEKVRERTLEIEKQNQAILLQSEELKAKQEEILQQAEQLKKANEEIKKVNANLEFLVAQRTADLKRANKELDLFLYRSSHDLRGPLTTLLGLVELGYLTHREQDAFNILEKVKIIVQNMDKTLEKLQMISEIDIAHKKDTTYLDFKTLLHQLLERFHPLIQERKIKVEKHLELHEPFETHPNLVRIILYNLIENAIMFSYPSDPFVKIYISTKKGILFMQVVDNGIGIPEGFREKIFDMYVRASETSKGNGLGLYVTKRAVLKLGGKIYLDNEIPKTMRITKFNVEIPKMPKSTPSY